MPNSRNVSSLAAVLLLATTASAFAPTITTRSIIRRLPLHPSATTTRQRGMIRQPASQLYALQADEDHQQQQQQQQRERTIKASAPQETPMIMEPKDTNESLAATNDKAAMGTINERLMTELQDAADKEKYGPKSGVGKKLGLAGRRNQKTPEEMEASLAEARDLNGVNPVVALSGGIFAFAVAVGLWYATNQLGTFFALHPVETDVYFVQRVASVFRNVVMGLSSLASGFFGVTGMGIFLLGVRVAVGVAKGELDPTPIKRKKQEGDKVEMPNVWDLMMNKKPSRRGGRGADNDNNPFGL